MGDESRCGGTSFAVLHDRRILLDSRSNIASISRNQSVAGRSAEFVAFSKTGAGGDRIGSDRNTFLTVGSKVVVTEKRNEQLRDGNGKSTDHS